jgi:protein-L-isoaspartate O-methyltransferase
MFRKIDYKTVEGISAEWDMLAPIRFQQITSGEDITYHHILIPNLLELLPRERVAATLDAGCGVGYFTNLLADHSERVVLRDRRRLRQPGIHETNDRQLG